MLRVETNKRRSTLWMIPPLRSHVGRVRRGKKRGSSRLETGSSRETACLSRIGRETKPEPPSAQAPIQPIVGPRLITTLPNVRPSSRPRPPVHALTTSSSRPVFQRPVPASAIPAFLHAACPFRYFCHFRFPHR